MKTLLQNYKSNTPAVKKAVEYIQRHDKFLLTTHFHADADGIGSEIGLYYLLQSLNKKCIILNSEPVPYNLRFITEGVDILDVNNFLDDSNLLEEQLNGYFAFILDSSDLERSKDVANIFLRSNCQWSSIDHHNVDHITQNSNLCVDSTYVATCEFIWDIYKYFNISFNNKVALALYTGIIADSGNFRYSKTSFRTHLAGGDLLSYGIDSDMIYRHLFECYPIDRLLLERNVFNNLYINKSLGFVFGYIDKNTLNGITVCENLHEGLVNRFMAVSDVNISCLAIETEDFYLKASLRSINDFDVSEIAKGFNGGGHINASGLKISMRFKKASVLLIEAVEKYLSYKKSV